MGASDWEPVRPEHLGAEVDLRKVPARRAPAPDGPKTAAEQRLLADEVEKQTQALAELKRRIDAAAAPISLVDRIGERERKGRRRRVVEKPELTEVTVHSDVQEKDVPLAVRYAQNADGRDPREDETWFRGLPAREQQRLRDSWTRTRVRLATARRWNPRRTGRAALHGAVLAGIIGLLCGLVGASAARICVLALAGALAAGTAQLSGGGRFVYSVAGIVAFFAVFAGAIFTSSFLIVGGLLMCYGFGALGMEQEMRLSGGFDARRPAEPPAPGGSAT